MKLRLSLIVLLINLYCLQANAAFLPIGPGPVSKDEIKAAANHFPVLLGTNLEGDDVMLPTELKGKFNLVLIAFERKQQADVDTWIEATKGLSDEYKGFEFYELPVIKAMNAFIRFNINNGMRYGIPDKDQRLRTITLYINKESFKQALNITNEQEVHALLVDDSGKIIWRESGLSSTNKVESLKLLLNE